MIRKNKNKGLSLVELIVALAILAVVGIAIMGFVAFSSRNYNIANKNVKLQYEQQVTVNRIRDIVLETSRGIAFDDTTHALTIITDIDATSLEDIPESILSDPIQLAQYKANNPGMACRIVFEEAEEGKDAGKLYLLKKKLTPSDIEGKTYADITFDGDKHELTDTVNAFSADLSNIGNGKVTLHITFKVGNREVKVSPEISLRNKIDLIENDSDLDEIYDKEVIEFTSIVAKVEISRDGKRFGQAKTDTIDMAGDVTSADYDAIVTKKSFYTGTIDTSVTWELEGLKDGYDYTAGGGCIQLSGDGLVTVRNVDGKTPADYMKNGEYFVLKAISVEDPTKIARLRIKVGTDGVYPEEITTTRPYASVQDIKNHQLVYTFKHSIRYTNPILNSAGTPVNPLTGDDVYAKITYSVFESDKKTPAKLPSGAGFSVTRTDGVFRVVKDMEEKKYWIKVAVVQKNKAGEEVFDWIELDIAKGSVPDIDVVLTELNLYTADNYNRADYNAVSVGWSNGTPTYDNGKSQYYCWYELEVEPVDGWGSGDRNTFKNTIYIAQEPQTDNGNSAAYTDATKDPQFLGQYLSDSLHSYVSDKDMSQMGSRGTTVYVNPRLDWSKTFTARVSVRALLSKTNSNTSTKYKAKNGAKIYKYDASRNEIAIRLNTGEVLNMTDADYDKEFGTRARQWNRYYYIDTDDVDRTLAMTSNGFVVYTGATDNHWWVGGSSTNVWETWFKSAELLSYEPNSYARYPYKVKVTYYTNYQHTATSSVTGYVDRNGLKFVYSINKDNVPVYEYPIKGNNGEAKNELVETAAGGEELNILGDSGDRYHISATIKGKTVEGYIFKEDTTSETVPVPVNKEYYKLPTDTDHLDEVTTSDKSEALVASKIVTINPVTLNLELPSSKPYIYTELGNNGKQKAYFDTDNTIYMGKGSSRMKINGYKMDDPVYQETEGYKYIDVQNRNDGYYGYKLDGDYCRYWKCFTPTFTGIKVSTYNYDKVLGKVRTTTSNGTDALRAYLSNDLLADRTFNYDCGYVFNQYYDSKLYVYFWIEPYTLRKKTPYPNSVRWICEVEGKNSSNYVKASSANNEGFFEYIIKNERDTVHNAD